MNDATNKKISWVVLVAFLAQLLPLPLFAENQPRKQIKINNLIKKIDKRVDKGAEVEDEKNQKKLDKLKSFSGFQKWDPVDFHVYIEGGGKKKPTPPNAGGGSSSGSGSSSSAGSGSSSGSGNGAVTSNEKAEGKPPGTQPEGSGAKGGSTVSDIDGSIAHPYYYPMCLFVDTAESTPGKMDGVIKEMIQMSDACGVNLVVFPRWVQGMAGNSSNTINGWASSSCNISEAIPDATSASVSTCVPDPYIAGEMCKVPQKEKAKIDAGIKWDDGTAGCAQVHAARGGGFSQTQLDDVNAATSGERLTAYTPGSGAVPSIERKGACNAGTITHEAQGHSQFGKPNGSDHGNGIGDLVYNPITKKYEEDKEGGGDAWSQAKGCVTMRNNSFANDGRWKYNPKRTQYMPRDMTRILNIQGNEKVFKKSIAKGGKSRNNGYEEVGGEIKSAGAPDNMRGYKVGRLGKIKVPGGSGAKGGHPEQNSFTKDQNGKLTKDGTDVPAGQSELGTPASEASITSNERIGEDAKNASTFDENFFKKDNDKPTGLAAIRSESGSNSSDGSGSSSAQLNSSADGNVGQIVYSARDTLETLAYTDPNDPEYLIRLNQQKVRKPKPDGRGSSLRNRLLTDVQAGATSIAATTSNENAAKGEAILERRSPGSGRSSLASTGSKRRETSDTSDSSDPFKATYAASSDPGLDKKRKKGSSRRPASERRQPVDGRESNRRSTVEQTPAYTDSPADFGE